MPHILEKNVPFSQSRIWDLQRQYFEEMGTEAWRQGEVPHYVTTNPRQANGYAEMVVALYKDYKALCNGAEPEPITLIELGGGSGRFAFYLIRRLFWLCEQEGIPTTAFRYVLTDFTQNILDFWLIHPQFQAWFKSGVLDIARFDATQPGPLELQISGTIVGASPTNSPCVVIANYVWDSIPQVLVCVQENELSEVLVSLQLDQDPEGLSTVDIFQNVQLEYALGTDVAEENVSLGKPMDVAEGNVSSAKPMENPLLRPVLETYRNCAPVAYLLFPALAIQCLDHLRGFSQRGLLLLTADKGGHELYQVLSGTPPNWAAHGSISMNVNYHALHTYATQQGGIHFFPAHQYHSINTGCIILLENAGAYTTTIRASRKYLDETGPDTYFTIYKCLRSHADTLELRDVLAALRLSLYDSHQLGIYVLRIAALLPSINPLEAGDLITVMHRCWENYFALAEDHDLATTLASICYALDAYDWALYYFAHSTDIYGPYTGTFYNMAVCYHMLGDAENARRLLEKVVAHDPGNADAVRLLAEYGGVLV